MSASGISKFKNHIIGLDNIDNSNEHFILRSPPRGKIYRGQISNAFNRQSLGSIPHKSEKILFKDIESENKKGFSSQCERFSQYKLKESVKHSFPGPGEYKDPYYTCNSHNNPSLSTKGYGNGFTSKNERFDDLKEYQEKFLPGPGEYKSNLSTDHINSNLRYKSLFVNNKIISLKVFKENPGPGDYDTDMPEVLKREEMNSSPNFFFKSRGERFDKFNEKVNNSPGPGKYFLDSNFINKKSKNFNIDNSSFFFKSNIPKKINPIEKYLNMNTNSCSDLNSFNDKNKKFYVTGLEENSISKNIMKSDDKFFSSEKSKIYMQNSEEKKKLLEIEIVKEKKNEISKRHNQNQSHNQNNSLISDNNYSYDNKGIKSVFLSKSPRNTYAISNHYPGPSYYHPSLIPERKSFNLNEEKAWI